MIEQLRELVFNGGFDDESKQSVLSFEQKLHELSVKENILKHQPVKEWFDYLTREKSNACLLLLTDRKLTTEQRTELFIRIDVANKYLSLLDTTEREEIEEDIKQALNAAKNQE